MTYPFRCECGRRETVIRTVDRRNDPVACVCGRQMVRSVGRFMFTANRFADMPENRTYHGDKFEVLAQQKADDASYYSMYENGEPEKAKKVTVDDIMGKMGAFQAFKEGNMENWREQNIPKLAADECDL